MMNEHTNPATVGSSVDRPMDRPALSVAEFVRMARQALEVQLPLTWIGGEISNFTRASSGHWYFVLKDATTQVRCVMFRNRNQFIDWLPANGQSIEVRALATLYEPRGEFQLGVEAMRRAGLGALYEALAQLKARLAAEGLFDTARKRSLPPYPRSIGIVTSPAAAALHDVLHVLARRWPRASVVLYPSPVQGEGAGARIAEAIAVASRRMECDVLLVVRGGGSAEDLWTFNEEAVVRAVAACRVPVISGVGHETDFTLCDLSADVRAPTPTAAAELATPDRDALRAWLAQIRRALHHAASRRLRAEAQRLDYAGRLLVPPRERLRLRRATVDHVWRNMVHLWRARIRASASGLMHLRQHLGRHAPDVRSAARELEVTRDRLGVALRQSLRARAHRLDMAASRLAALDPHKVLARGYAIVTGPDGMILRDSSRCMPGERLGVALAHGALDVTVERVRKDE